MSRILGRNDERARFAALAADVESNGPAWYSPWSNEVQPAFGEALSTLRGFCVQPGKVLARLDDRLSALRAQEALLEAGLRRRNLTISSYSLESLRAAATATGDASAKAMDALFAARLEVFKTSELAAATQAWRRCLRLAALCRYDFDGALTRVMNEKGRFRTLSADDVLRQIDDLRFILDGFSCDATALAALTVLAGPASGKASDPRGLRDALAGIATLIAGPLAPDRLAAVLRTAVMDPSRELKGWPPDPDIRKPLVERLIGEYHENRKGHVDRLMAARLEARQAALFGDAPLLAVELYDEERAALFAEHGIPGFHRVRALSVLWTYLKTRHENLVRHPVADLLAVLESRSAAFEESLGSAFAAVGAFARGLETFEADLISPDRSPLPAAIKHLSGGKPDLVLKKKAAKAAKEIDDRAEALIAEAAAAAASLHTCLEKLLADLRLPSPVLAENGQALVAGHAPLIQSIDRARATLKALLELLEALP